MANTKPRITSPPKIIIAPSAKAVVTAVITVRDSVSLTVRFITSISGSDLDLIRFSRRRSKTTTVSFTE